MLSKGDFITPLLIGFLTALSMYILLDDIVISVPVWLAVGVHGLALIFWAFTLLYIARFLYYRYRR